MLDWKALANPVYRREGWSTKDACMVFDGKVFHIFFSAFYWSRGRERSHVVGVKTADFKTFSTPLFIWDGREDGWTGMCSPNVSRTGHEYILTLNSWGDKHPNGKPNQLFYAASQDLQSWGTLRPLACRLTRGVRAIDAALSYAHGNHYLVWKEQQTPQVAFCDRLDGDWIRLGQPSGGWFENAQFLNIDGKWFLLATRSGDQPYLMKMKGSGKRPDEWLTWAEPEKLLVPEEQFNTDSRANAAFMADWREHDGHFYLIYAGTTEGKTHAGRGDNRLGLARSRDLMAWEAPGGAPISESSRVGDP